MFSVSNSFLFLHQSSFSEGTLSFARGSASNPASDRRVPMLRAIHPTIVSILMKYC